MLGRQRRSLMKVRDSSNGCFPANGINDVAPQLNIALQQGGPGFTLSLCPSTKYYIQRPVAFTAPNQEISTLGLPTDDTRATLVVDGQVYANHSGHSVAITGQCGGCDNLTLRHIQINGTRLGRPGVFSGPWSGANIEMGGESSGQLIEYVRSYDPRGWSCLHISEGGEKCTGAIVRNNDIGPCGTDEWQQWADGISFACSNGQVLNNLIENPTDGGIVLFGSPGTRVENNTIWAVNNTLIGGINMVDFSPYGGNYTGTVVTNNIISGTFANEAGNATVGENKQDVFVKLGIAIGPHIWFGTQPKFVANNVSFGGTVTNNKFTGAMGFAIGVASTRDFVIQNNVLVDNYTFIGARGPNCSTPDKWPTSAPFVVDSTGTSNDLQSDFKLISDADGLTCTLPPTNGDYWPYGGNPGTDSSFQPPVSPVEAPSSPSSNSPGRIAAIAAGTIGGFIVVALVAWVIHKKAIARLQNKSSQKPYRTSYLKYKH